MSRSQAWRAGVVVAALCSLWAGPARADQLCPAAKDLPQLYITDIHEPAVPVIDQWQVFWGDISLSDAQLAKLAGRDPLIDRTREEMKSRGAWVFAGLATAAAGIAVSSVGWVLYGQDELDQGITLPLAAGGLLVGILGALITTESIQTPLEPHLAPTPRHRLSREEVRELVVQINRKLYHDICAAADAADAADAVGAAERTP